MVHLILCLALQAGSFPAPADRPFYAFCERLAMAETQIQMDHFRAVAAKRPGELRKKLDGDLRSATTSIGADRKSVLEPMAGTKDYGDYAGLLGASLDALVGTEDSLSSFLAQHPDAKESRDEGRLWSAHASAFHKVISTCWKFPHFSELGINPAIYYNITPRLHEEAEFPVLADPSHPEEARIGETFVERDPKLIRGDVIVAYWMPEDKKWVDVKTWRDLMAAPNDAIDEESHLLRMRVLRRGKEVEASVSFVPIYQDVD